MQDLGTDGTFGCSLRDTKGSNQLIFGFSAEAPPNTRLVMLPLRDWDDKGSNLVDSASSHTLVSKIKPCMSKYKSLTLKLRTAHYISYSLFDSPLLLG